MNEKFYLINFLEYSLEELKEVLKIAKKSEFDDDMFIYLQGYAYALGDVISALKHRLKGEKNE
jgi:hypothetical protein